MTRIIGIAPIPKQKKELFDKLIVFLHSKIKKVGNPYIIPPELKDAMKKDLDNEILLTKAAKDIIAHCGLNASFLRVEVENIAPNTAGQYSENLIIINHLENTSYTKTMAVLIHECMHYYLGCRDIHLQDTTSNEYLTDIATLYMGFGDYINRGYVMAGYIKRHEIRYIKSRINKLR
ncbi:MAG: hypothetical protein K6E63_05800 [Lachnospiraceae bacterium]|nr:hypothetical protein [Lachnospiraceae bacterium]